MRTKSDVRVDGELVGQGKTAGDLMRALEADDRFRRDTFFGGIFHPGRICFREISPTDSLHVVIRGERVSAHIDDVSPLVVRPDGTRRYAWGRVLAHNALLLLADVGRRLRGRRGQQRCNLQCETEWVDDGDDDLDAA